MEESDNRSMGDEVGMLLFSSSFVVELSLLKLEYVQY